MLQKDHYLVEALLCESLAVLTALNGEVDGIYSALESIHSPLMRH